MTLTVEQFQKGGRTEIMAGKASKQNQSLSLCLNFYFYGTVHRLQLLPWCSLYCTTDKRPDSPQGLVTFHVAECPSAKKQTKREGMLISLHLSQNYSLHFTDQSNNSILALIILCCINFQSTKAQ